MLSRELIQHNFWLKLSSLILATLIWFTVFADQHNIQFSRNPITQPDSKRFAHVSVSIKARPGKQADIKLTPSEVAISVKGSPAILRNLGIQDVTAMVDVTQLGEGEGIIMKVQVFTPNGTTVESVSPVEIRVDIQTGSNAPPFLP